MTRAPLTLAALVLGAALAAPGCGGGDGDGDDAPDAAPDAPIGETGPIAVTGRVQFEDRAPLPTGRLGPIEVVPARAVAVALVDADGTVLGEAVAGEDGAYSVTGTGVYGSQVHIIAATTSDDPARPVHVRRTNGQYHGFGGPDFTALPTQTADVLVTEASGEAGAFNIYEQLIRTVDTITTLGATPERFTAVWQRGATDGTYYLPSENTTYLLGASSDDDGYDDPVILHETGHYVEDAIGRSDSPGGFHDGSPTDPRLAWSEGFATYWANAVAGSPIYVDTNASGGWAYNADTSVTQANPNGTLGQNVSENMVNEILWDLGDAPGTDDDTLAGSHPTGLRVQPEYLAVMVLRTVGASGADLVDFLDGWFVEDGVGRCTQARSIVTTTHRFPYDYDGPMPCP